MTNIFNWIKEIERIYEDLIQNAKDLNFKNIDEFRENQGKKFEEFLEKKNNLVNNALIKLTTESKTQTKMFEEQMDGAIKKIEKDFQKQVSKIYELIIKEVGLDF